MQRFRTILIALACLVAASACAQSIGTRGQTLEHGRIGFIHVSVDNRWAISGLQTSLDANGTRERLEARTEQALRSRDAWERAGALVLRIEIDQYRLSTGGSSSTIASGDFLGAKVRVVKGSEIIREFHADATLPGSSATIGPASQRSNRLADTLARRIAERL